MSFLRYEKYKDSGVEWLGEVPEHWVVKKLGFIGEAIIGLTYSPNDVVDEGLLVLRSSNVQGGKISFHNNVFVNKSVNQKLIVRDGDILICSRNGSRDLIGKNALIDKDSKGMTFGAFMTIYRSRMNQFLFCVFNSYIFSAQAGSFMTSTVNQLTTGNLNSFLVPVPPLGEQTQIACFLHYETVRIDALIAEQQRLTDLLIENRQAVISHAVTKGLNPTVPVKDSGVEWLGKVPEHWTVCKLNFRYSVDLGKMLDEKKITGLCLLPYLRNQDVRWGEVNVDRLPQMDIRPEEIGRYTVRNGDLLVCEGGDMGRAAIWREEKRLIGYQKALHRLRIRSQETDTAEFFFFVLLAAKALGVFDESDTKTTFSHLPAEKFRQHIFGFPPLSEQKEIALVLSEKMKQSDAAVALAYQSIDLLSERRSALISAAVTGKIDVRDWQPPASPSNNAQSEPLLEAAYGR